MDPLVQATIAGFLGGGVFSALFSYLTYREHWKRNIGDAFFGCLEAYYKVMEYHTKAEIEKSFEGYFTYFRALFDLQWSEYQMWLLGYLQDKPYKAWCSARYNDYSLVEISSTDAYGQSFPISYKIVWDKLIKDGYYSSNDSFISHMTLVHAGRIEDALRERKFRTIRKILHLG
jgi:hypothetical protein